MAQFAEFAETETFREFLMAARRTYAQFCDSVDNGEIPAGNGVQLIIDVTPEGVDKVRFDRLVAAAESN